MFEHRREPLVSKRVFVNRMLYHSGMACIVIFASLLLGVLGYRYFVNLSWLDSLLNASMILSGMGPVNEIKTASGKFFASFYALFSGVAFITTAGILFAPVIHRFLHKFHIETGSK